METEKVKKLDTLSTSSLNFLPHTPSHQFYHTIPISIQQLDGSEMVYKIGRFSPKVLHLERSYAHARTAGKQDGYPFVPMITNEKVISSNMVQLQKESC